MIFGIIVTIVVFRVGIFSFPFFLLEILPRTRLSSSKVRQFEHSDF